jgi:hypothetical protein
MAGTSSLWARATAIKYKCVVTVGYPEQVTAVAKPPASPEYYNSVITVSADGQTISNYRKSFLYYGDEAHAQGPDGFFDGEIAGSRNVAMGNLGLPTDYKPEVPWDPWEFALHVLDKQANLIILSMGWRNFREERLHPEAGSGSIPEVSIHKRYCTVLLSIAYTDTYRYRINTAYLNYPTPSHFLLLTTFSSSSYNDTLKYTLKWLPHLRQMIALHD